MAGIIRPPSRRVSIDTGVLIDIAKEEPTAHKAVEALQNGSTGLFEIFILPTPLQELASYAYSDGGELGELCYYAGTNLIKWGFTPIDLRAFAHGITERVSDLIHQHGLLSEDELNNALTIVEASLAEVDLLLTNSKVMLKADGKALNNLLLSQDLSTLHIDNPEGVVESF